MKIGVVINRFDKFETREYDYTIEIFNTNMFREIF